MSASSSAWISPTPGRDASCLSLLGIAWSMTSYRIWHIHRWAINPKWLIGIPLAYISNDFHLHLSRNSILFSSPSSLSLSRLKLMARPKWSQSKTPSKARKIEQRIKFGNYHLDLVKHPENVYAMHLCLDSNNIFRYCTSIYATWHVDTFCECGNSQSEVAKVWRC